MSKEVVEPVGRHPLFVISGERHLHTNTVATMSMVVATSQCAMVRKGK